MILETERLCLRKMTRDDLPFLRTILQDDAVMTAYGGAFGDDEVQGWLDRQLSRYHEYGFGLWVAVLKETGTLIGQCGLTMQDYKNGQVLEIGYLFLKEYWHHGYATEAATACKEYAFSKNSAEAVYSIIRDTNYPSMAVARRNGMHCMDGFVKHYRGTDMPHLLYGVHRDEKLEIAYLADHTEHTLTCACWGYGHWACQSGAAFALVHDKFTQGAAGKEALPLTILALYDSKPAGMISLWKTDAGRTDLTPWLGSLYVHPFHRGKKISIALIDRLIAEARRLGFGELYLVTEEAKGLYERFGWTELERMERPYGNASLMRKQLD